MRKNIILLLLAAFGVALTPAATATASKTVAVSITKTAFVPKSIAITVNDTVKWTNKDTGNHQVACQKCPFTSPVLKPGQSFSYTWKKVGKFAIRDPLHTNIKGSVKVNAPPRGVSLAADPRVVKYGQDTVLSGAVSNRAASEKVFVLGKECGQEVFTKLVTVDTTAGGNYVTEPVMPLRNTAYEAKWRTATSDPVTVRVRPKMKLRKVAPRKFRVRVRTAQSFAGKRAIFQRYRPVTNTWVKVRRVKLKDIRTVGDTVISGKTFKSKVKRKRFVRIKMKTSEVRPCYLGGTSNKITS